MDRMVIGAIHRLITITFQGNLDFAKTFAYFHGEENNRDIKYELLSISLSRTVDIFR